MLTPMLHRLRRKGCARAGRHNPAHWAEPPSRAPREEEPGFYAATRIVVVRIDLQFLWYEVEPSSARHRYADLARPDPLRRKEIPGRVGITVRSA
jgi:hypothetical protein